MEKKSRTTSRQRKRRVSLKRPVLQRVRHRVRQRKNRNRVQSRSRSDRLLDYSAGVKEGNAWRSSAAYDANPWRLKEVVQKRWNQRFQVTNRQAKPSWKHVQHRGESYAAGFMQGAGAKFHLIPVPLLHKATAVVCASADEAALRAVLIELEALPLTEVVIILGQFTESMFTLARSYPNTVIAAVQEKIDYDVGRALGTKLTDAETILFVDGEHPVHASVLAQFLWECEGKWDVVLNDQSKHMGLFYQRGYVERFYEFLNASLRREDLGINSLAALPFAISRRALLTLGADTLTVPVKAHARSIIKGLRIGIGPAASIRKSPRVSGSDGDWKQAAGDHIEAWSEAMGVRGDRMLFADSSRNRSLLGEWGR